MVKRVTTIFLFLLITERVSSQHLPSIQTDRPDQTECPFIVPKNHFQMEAGFVYEKNSDAVNMSIPAALLKFGLSKNFEVRLITEVTSYKDSTRGIATTGFEPVEIGFKLNICREDGIIPTTSFISHLAIPKFASEKFEATYYSTNFRFTMQNTLNETFVLGYNIGAEWDGESPEPVFIYTFATGVSISEKFGGYIETYGFAPQKSKADHRIDGGLTYLLKENIQLDVSGGVGLTNNAPDYFWGLGFSFRVPD